MEENTLRENVELVIDRIKRLDVARADPSPPLLSSPDPSDHISAPHPASFPRSSSPCRFSINSLPVEILAQILDVAARDMRRTHGFDGRYELLRATSLVHSVGWREESQRLLFDQVALCWESGALAFLETISGNEHRWRTSFLSLWGLGAQERGSDGFLDTTTAHAVLARVRGLSHLHIRQFSEEDRFSARSLCSPNLKDLTFIKINDGFLHSDFSDINPPLLPFALEELHLSDYHSDSDHCYSFFSSPRLRRLRLHLYFPLLLAQRTDLAQLVSSAAGTLESLHFQAYTIPKPLVSAIAPCTNLKDLKLRSTDEEVFEVIEGLQSTLDSLTLELSEVDVDYFARLWIPNVAPSLESLAVLHLTSPSGYARSDVVKEKRGKLLLPVLNSRGVEVDFMD